MTQPKANFNKPALKRAISALDDEGVEICSVEIRMDGTIRLVCGTNQPNVKNDFDGDENAQA